MILQRRVGERILLRLGSLEAWVTLAEIRSPTTCVLAIDAPRCIYVGREECVGKEPPPPSYGRPAGEPERGKGHGYENGG